MPHKTIERDEEEKFLLRLVEEAYPKRNKGTKMATLANDFPFRFRGAVVPVGAQVTFYNDCRWQDASVTCVSTTHYTATLRIRSSGIDIRHTPLRRNPFSYNS